METPKRGRGRPPKHPRPTITPPPELVAPVAQPEEIIINAPLAAQRPPPPLELPPFLQLEPVDTGAAGLGGSAAPGARPSRDFIAYLEERSQRQRIGAGLARVWPDDPPVRHPVRRRLWEHRYPAALAAPAYASRRDAPPAEVPAPQPGDDAPRWSLPERVIFLTLVAGLALALLGSAAANWVLSQGHAPPVAAHVAPPAKVAQMSGPPSAAAPLVRPPDAEPSPPAPDLAAIRIIPPPTSPPVLASSISYAPPADVPANIPDPIQAPPPANPAPPPVAALAPIIVQEVVAPTVAPPLPQHPTYDDPAIISGGSIAGQTPVNEPTPPPLAQGGGGDSTPQHPIYDDPNINSGGSIGGDGK